MVTAYRAFVKSRVFDNPFISRNYIETLNQAPPAEPKRLRWDVDEGDYMLWPWASSLPYPPAVSP